MYVMLCKINGKQMLRLNISEKINEITLNAYSYDKEIKVLSENIKDINMISDFIEANNVSVIQVVSNLGSTESSDLCFLKAIKNKIAIKEIDIAVNATSLDYVYNFSNLECLKLFNSFRNYIYVNISGFSMLKELILNGNVKVEGLVSSNLKNLTVNEATNYSFNEQCISLENLTLIHVTGIFLNNIAMSFPTLKRLTLTQIGITTLNGIKDLESLEEIEINYCNKLNDISEIVHCAKLKKVYFEGINKISDISPLVALKQLKDLTFFKCGNLPSLSFINAIPSLENLLFTDTNIVDGDLTPCMRLKSAWSSFGKQHYNIDVKDLPHL